MNKVFQRLPLFLVAILFITPVFAGTASAELGDRDELEVWADVAEDIGEAPGYEDPKDGKRKWTLRIGYAGGVSPEYEGSDDYGFGSGLNLAGSWRDTLFFKGKTLGANIIRQKNLKAGPILAWTSGRDEDDDDNLEGLGDVDSSIEAGGFISYRYKPMRFRLEARQDIDSGHEGALVELSGGTTLPFDRALLFVSLGTTWASDDYMKSYFGIDSKQSANSGYKKYNAESGIKDVKVSVTSGYKISARWRIGGKFEYKRLVGDAADSPIIDDKNQYLAGFGLTYHMGSKFIPEDQILE